MRRFRSPQARGSTGRCRAQRRDPRPIPAGAGLNRHRQWGDQSPRADPRRRGAQPSDARISGPLAARSPQARGSTGAGGGHRLRPLPIPAGAGLNRPRPTASPASGPDPRRRGAQPETVGATDLTKIRSPQARGSTAVAGRLPAGLRPIPAGAGLNRSCRRARSSWRPDPRRRGAQPSSGLLSMVGSNRSPQARGSTGRTMGQVRSLAPIPAGAGLNRMLWRISAASTSDPRRRGAQPALRKVFGDMEPRSPQARGSTGVIAQARDCDAPIPAGAGLNRTGPATAATRPPDPRRRGAQPYPRLERADLWLRSPQARGSTALGPTSTMGERPIPAGAGLNRADMACDGVHRPDPRRRGAQPQTAPRPCRCPPRSPQARGSTADHLGLSAGAGPIPAGAGLNRRIRPRRPKGAADPRRRGAQPPHNEIYDLMHHRSPQARGSTAQSRIHVRHCDPIPAGAGLNRAHIPTASSPIPDPRRRGAQPV